MLRLRELHVGRSRVLHRKLFGRRKTLSLWKLGPIGSKAVDALTLTLT